MTDTAAHPTTPHGRDTTIGDQLRDHARTQPHTPAVITYDEHGTRTAATYRQLNERANEFAHLLTACGLHHGCRVASMARNSIDVIAAYYGALKIGATFTAINPHHREHDVRHQLSHARLVLTDTEYEPLANTVLPSRAACMVYGGAELTACLSVQPCDEPDVTVNEDDIAVIGYTPGTEDAPKGVLIPHRNYLACSAPAWGWDWDTGPGDTWLLVIPFHTLAGLGTMTSLTMMGATLVLPSVVEPASALRMIASEHVTIIAHTSTFYVSLSHHKQFGPDTVGHVRRCFTDGGQIPARVIDAWAQAAPALLWATHWGQAELTQIGTVGFFRTLDDIPHQAPTWMGKPVTQLDIRVVDENGNDAEIGELLCHSPSVMLSYLDDPHRTAQTLRDGWVHTGDMVRIDADGNLFFHDRINDVIHTAAGENVSSQEVERALGEHPSVLKAAAVAIPDSSWTEAVAAFVVPMDRTEPPRAEDLIEHCAQRLASHKVPTTVRYIVTFPYNAQGKILKRELRATARKAAARPREHLQSSVDGNWFVGGKNLSGGTPRTGA